MDGRQVTLGIYVDGDPAALEASVRSIIEHAGMALELVLLVDADSFAAGRYPFKAHRVGNGAGRAAAFNRLVAAHDSARYVFLENGVRLGPSCLRRLCAALDADPAHGLAGPSTDRAWNEQAQPPQPASGPYALELGAEAAARRYGDSWRTLEPLHSLSDFCYAVRRDVVIAIGAADEGYGSGPCWEMDYNIRAARAGFKALWVGAAYAERGAHPATPAAQAERAFTASRQRYQDSFCARLDQPGAAYSAHCKGEQCAYFAQPQRLTLRVALPPAPAAAPAHAPGLPLVSCIMPTCGRARFVAQAIGYFLRQDYPQRELVIAFERDEDLPAHAPDSRIRYLRTPAGSSIGAKRNAAAAAAAGAIIAQWDDDDWYGVTRLSLQVWPIVAGVAEISGVGDTQFLQIDQGQCWHASAALHRRLFVENVCGGSLVFTRAAWESAGGYPATSLREDADMMVAAMRHGARLCRVPAHEAFVYIRHRANTWRFDEGSYLEADQWRKVAHPSCMDGDSAFYAAHLNAGALAAAPAPLPMVSCIMPTAGRRQFVPAAIGHFLRQGYPNKELIIVDDGADPVADLVPEHPAISYVRLPRKASIGAKRNHACMIALGSIIAHWDDDDWMGPDWLASQVQTLLSSGADVCGLDKVYFHAPAQGRAWRYVYDGVRPWVAGGTLCYTRDCWEKSPFPDMQVGEDTAFLWNGVKRLAVNDACRSYVATVHPGNTSTKHTTDRRWTEHPVDDIVNFINSAQA
ncbi:glycosyltransferase [Massilia sp. CCM 8733]|uniref:Glycosyltransferase n=2 Tax=Massilia mucilaginosa TaxID=2609282 RepID=A0ABX0NT07_9BURK|nr:glycosyltransferase [Massilia mucilaginosa]